MREALVGMQAAFDEAARRRVQIVRRLAALKVSEDDAPARRALVEAVLRREAADADEEAPVRDRVARVAAEARAGARAREALAANAEVQALADELDATWRDALAQCDRLAAGLVGQVPPETATAFAAYVEALRAAHGVDPQAGAADVDAATDQLQAAYARLERALGAD